MLFRKEKCFPETKTANLACDRSELVGYGVTGLMTNSAWFIVLRDERLSCSAGIGFEPTTFRL
jgi:hypothetical protein